MFDVIGFIFFAALVGLDILSIIFSMNLMGNALNGLCVSKSAQFPGRVAAFLAALSCIMLPPALSGLVLGAFLIFFFSFVFSVKLPNSEIKFAPFVVSLSIAFWAFNLVRIGFCHSFFLLNIFHNTVSVVFGILMYSLAVYGQAGVERVKQSGAGRVSAYDVLAALLTAPVLAYGDIKDALRTYTINDFLFKGNTSAFALNKEAEGEGADQKPAAKED